MNNKRLTKFITGAVAASVVFASGFTAFAAQRSKITGSTPSNVKNFLSAEKPKEGKGFDKDGYFTSILNEMVKDGTLTQSEADKINAYRKEKQKSMKAEMEKIKEMTEEERKNYFSTKKPEGQDFFTELVTNGIITRDKADAIKARVQLKKQELKTARLNEIKSKLSTLVDNKTINQAQADKVLEYLNQNKGGKCRLGKENISETDKEKIKSMTEEERKSYFEKMRGEKGSFLKELVDNGTLTQDQADAIEKAIHSRDKRGIRGN